MTTNAAAPSVSVTLHKLVLSACCLYHIFYTPAGVSRFIRELPVLFARLGEGDAIPLVLSLVHLLIPCLILFSLFKSGPGPYYRVRNLLCLALALQITNALYLLTIFSIDEFLLTIAGRFTNNHSWLITTGILLYMTTYFHRSVALRENFLRQAPQKR